MSDGGGGRNGYLSNAFFQDLLVDVKETSSKVIPFDSAEGRNTEHFPRHMGPYRSRNATSLTDTRILSRSNGKIFNPI